MLMYTATKAKAAATAKKKEDGERVIVRDGRRIMYEMKTTINLRFTNEKLKAVIKYKRKKNDKRPIPTKKGDLEKRWAEMNIQIRWRCLWIFG